MSRIIRFEQISFWKRALNAARRTVGKNPLNKDPSNEWKAKMLLAEHSPIRLVEFEWPWENIKQWVTVHLVRHHVGCEKFVHSQREDRRDLEIPRDELPQGSLNDMDMTANAQSLIYISRKRLCSCASKETREAWMQVKEKINEIDPILAEKMVRECIYRGFCPEFMGCCGYNRTLDFKKELVRYRNTDYNDNWLDIPEIEGIEVSRLGYLRFKDTKELIKTSIDKSNNQLFYYYPKESIRLYPSVIVYKVFGDGVFHKPNEIIHLDENNINNHIKNLMYESNL